MIKAGITGGIGSGKSTVAKAFMVLGIPVFNADNAAREMMNNDEGLRKKIIDIFGTGAYSDEGLNRKFIADIVFNDPYKLEQLNSIVHPVTIAAAEQWMQQQTTGYALKEAALMFESPAAGHLDYVIGVYAPLHLRIQRIIQRDKISREEIMARINRQIDEEIKMKLCDFVIINDEQKPVIPQVLELHNKLILMAEPRN